MPRLLVHFARYGPYHHARLKSAAAVLGPLGWEVIGLETAGSDATYAWDQASGGASSPRIVTAFPGRVYEEITSKESRCVLHPLLDNLNPDAIAIAGWASPDALFCLSWCRKNDRQRIVMSETRQADGHRVWWKELTKRYLISRFDAALVGGKSHRDYLVKLGLSTDRIRLGYNVVDNAYFGEKTQDHKKQGTREQDGFEAASGSSQGFPNALSSIPNIRSPFFLASNRFIERKNLSRLIDAYAAYVKSCRLSVVGCRLSEGLENGIMHPPRSLQIQGLSTERCSSSRPPETDIGQRTTSAWSLVLLGDGELKVSLIAQCHELGLQVIESAPWEHNRNFECEILDDECNQPAVLFPGFRQIEELPRFYAHAGCFVHPALEEPWGLVINEAMACGLPILSSRNVGAAEELVDDGVNGWCFDAGNVEMIAAYLGRVASLDDTERKNLGVASLRILEERCPLSAFGRGLSEILQ